jgi:lipooligosaccharide transport system ATP-binding protein
MQWYNPNMDIVTAEGLTKYYNSFLAVDNVDFSIKKGECFGFLGPNGAGKTTVMSIIYCFFPPTSGTVRVFGTDVTEDTSGIKAKEGVMPQDDNLDPDLTVLENLIVYARYFDIPRKHSEQRAIELIKFVGLENKENINIRKLSGGMRRRLLLARSIINDPELLVLDEPTTGMDPHGRHAVWDSLDDLKKKETTLVLTTHYMEEAENICDRVAIMDHGKIVEVDTPKNLMWSYGGNLEEVYLKLTGKRLEG